MLITVLIILPKGDKIYSEKQAGCFVILLFLPV